MIDVCCALIFHEKRLLAVQRPLKSDHPLQWELPGGKVEADEDFEACIIREIQEELHIAVWPEARLKSVTHQYPSKSIHLIPFVCRKLSGELHLAEHESMTWVGADELTTINWQDADQKLIRENEDQILHWLGKDDGKS